MPCNKCSGIDRAFPGRRLTQPEGENEDKNEESLGKLKWEKNDRNLRKNEESGTLAHPLLWRYALNKRNLLKMLYKWNISTQSSTEKQSGFQWFELNLLNSTIAHCHWDAAKSISCGQQN